MYPDFVRLWIFNKKIGNFFERKLRIYKNFNLKIQIDFFLLGPTFFLINVPVRGLYWSDVCTSLTFVLVRCLYWSDVCTGPTFVPSDVCKSYVCTVRRLWVRRLYWYHKNFSTLLSIKGFYWGRGGGQKTLIRTWFLFQSSYWFCWLEVNNLDLLGFLKYKIKLNFGFSLKWLADLSIQDKNFKFFRNNDRDKWRVI